MFLVFPVSVHRPSSYSQNHCSLQSTGANREVKKAVEAYWAGKLSAEELTLAAAEVRKSSWTSIKERGVDLIPRLVLSFHSENITDQISL